MKRRAEHQMTKDECEAGDDGDAEAGSRGEFARASADKLAQRTFVKVRRKGAAGGATATPAAGAANPFAALTASAPAAAAPAAAAAPNAFAAAAAKAGNMGAAGSWECPTCMITNKPDATVCPACETKKPGASGAAAPAAAAAPAVNAFAAAAAKAGNMGAAGSWECPTCMITNKPDATVCPACETKKPGAAAAPAAGDGASSPPKFTFGSGAASGGSGAAAGTDAKPQFTFGSTASSNSGSGGGFTFGGQATAAKTGGFTFGGASVNGSASSPPAAAAAAFGSAAAPAKPATASSFAGAREAKGDEDDVVMLRTPGVRVYLLAPVDEGEAKEGDKKKTKWAEMGTGDLCVNKVPATGGAGGDKHRLVLRADSTKRLVLNSLFFKGMQFTLQGDKYVRFAAGDEKGELVTYLLKFRAPADASAVHTQCEAVAAKLS